MSKPILGATNISVSFSMGRSLLPSGSRDGRRWLERHSIQALDDVSLELKRGEVIGLVGESGCGKSTLARVLNGLQPPGRGAVSFKGDVIAPGIAKRDRSVALAIQTIFQDPWSSLNPLFTVRRSITEAPLKHGLFRRREAGEQAENLMRLVGLAPDLLDRYPHQLSGGQLQRVVIARALAVKPEVLICDEAVSALDVSIQAQIINLFLDLKDSLDLSYIFISHDLSVIEHISDRVLVMYLGRIVEAGERDAIFGGTKHPYTQALLKSRPDIRQFGTGEAPIRGELPSPIDPPTGCHFHPRCPFASDRCIADVPRLTAISDRHATACHHSDRL